VTVVSHMSLYHHRSAAMTTVHSQNAESLVINRTV